MMVRLGVTGATGAMGQEVLSAVAGRTEFATVVGFTASGVDDTVAGVEVVSDDDFEAVLADREIDVVVDFTVPDATVDYAAACADSGTALVTGTTGLSTEQEAALDDASEAVPVLHAANFSKGIAVLRSLVREAAGALDDYDIELVEAHHNRKRDAPSGTANTLLDDVESVRGEEDRVHGREGEAPRTEGEVGVHALRAGNVTGLHEVWLAGGHEELRLSHRAESRGVFAEGALDAAQWLAGRDAGRYDFSDVLEGDDE
ncbi:4-hydroxy-tetrahydrodipicolinate reductase [Haloarchaeobius sp. DT45]|uniref:4-hydroxy-tetrahydrodipicolinate reductase n=1 Tax=Haloarchaeobius sp. DT45 TaxID=3446116 RepID=UPI003F6CEB26